MKLGGGEDWFVWIEKKMYLVVFMENNYRTLTM